MFSIKKLFEPPKREIKVDDKKIKDFWMNYPQTLFLKDHHNVVVLRGRDIECCWCLEDKDEYLIRTHSGKEFSLALSSWLKVRFENADYVSEH